MRLAMSIRHTRVFALLLFVGLAFPSYISGQSRFHFITTPSLDPGDTVYTVVMGDFNGDGKLDIATATSADYFGGGPNPQKVVVFLGNGNGTFQARRQFDYSSLTGAGATFQLAADFNGDGILDLALGNGMTTLLSNGLGNQVTIHLGDGAGNFAPFSAFTTGGSGLSPSGGTGLPLTAADYNEDGKMDLVVGAGGDSSVRLHLGNGNGTFQSGGTIIQYTGSGNPWPLAADLNGDDHQDVVVWDDAVNQIFILLGNGSGSFTSSTITLPNAIRRAALGDLNNDGKLDLVGAGSGDLMVLLGNGDGTFQPAVDIPVADSILAGCVIADFDLDDKADVAATSSHHISGGTDNRVLVFPGDGAGNLGTPETFTGNWWPQGMVAADFNNDGLPDLAFAAHNFDIPVLINSALGPPNDNWVSAAVVNSLPYTSIVDTTQATTELTDPYPGCGNSSTANSVWYVFTPTSNGIVTANTFGSNYDTILSAFTGGPDAFSLQACDDDTSGLQSQISFGVTAGITYSLMATSYGSGGGSLVFNLSFMPTAPYVSLSPTALDFGDQVVNTTSPAQTVTVTNVGNTDLAVSGVSLSGLIPQDFMIVSDTCSGAYVVPSRHFSPVFLADGW